MRLKTQVKPVFHWANLFAQSDFVGIALVDGMG
jgi:hypothetical protein